MDFEGHHETVRLENGRSFGIPPQIYYSLAQASISVSELAGIEPQLLEHLPDRDGCLCTLYGRSRMFVIRIDMSKPPTVSLFQQTLDSPNIAECVLGGSPDSFDCWRAIVNHMLVAENFIGVSWEELNYLHPEWHPE